VSKAEMKDCPVPGCESGTKRNYLMCAFHWARVPRKLQTAVYKTWRAYCDGHGQHSDYTAAADAAIAAAERGRQ
jgi:hypothetical protein